MKVQSTLFAFSLLSLASALPAVKRDSSIGEPAVEAPNGTPITLTSGAAPTPTSVDDSNSNSCSSDDCNDTTSMMMDTTTMMDDSTSTMMMDTTTMMDDSTSTMMYDTTSTMAYDTYTTDAYDTYTYATADATSTYDTYYTYATADATSTYMTSMATATYGSGYTPSSYDSCVQQCMASYGPPPSMVTATPSYPAGYDSSATGTGATHTVIVAPTQGVLRYVPFAVNASVGDTVRFVWGAGPHTVTKSSQFNLCNATLDAPFKSGPQNASFVFDQLINDTNPTFYYCGVPTHCEKGMFGIINPPIAEPGAQNSAQGMTAIMAQNNSDVSAQWSYTMMNIQNSTAASAWGQNIDVTAMTTDPEGQLAIVQNYMFTKLAMSQNEQYIAPDGSFNPNIATGLNVPMDPTKLSTSNSTGTYNAGSSPSGSSTASTAPAASSSTSGASRRVASSATAVIAAVAFAALAL